MSTKGLTRRITRKQALSYERTSPNGIGVTSIASVNGRRKGPPAAVRRVLKGCGKQLKAAWKEVKKGKKAAPKRARRNPEATMATPNYVRRYGATKAILRGHRARPNPMDFGGFEGFAGLPEEVKRREKAEKRAEQAERRADRAEERALQLGKETKMAKPKKRKSAAKKPAKKRASGKTTKRASRRHAGAARSFGKFKPLSVKIGGKSRTTYLHKSKGGGVRHIPIYALHGFKSQAAFKKAQMEGDDKTREKINRRGQAIQRLRDRAKARIEKEGDIFTPNTTVIPYSEWSRNMTPNKRKSAKKAAKKKTSARKARRSPAQIKAAKRNIKKAQAAAKKGRKAGKKRGARKSAKKAGKRTAAQRSASARKAARTRKRHAAAKSSKRKAPKRKKGAHKAAKRGKRTAAQRSASARKAARTRKRNLAAGKRPSKRKGGKKRYHRNAGAVATPNRRRHHRRYAENRRRYRRNGYMDQLKSGLKVGAVIVGSFLAHKVLSNLLVNQGLNRVAYFNDPKVAPYKGLLAGVIVAAIGIPLAAKFSSKEDTINQIAGGMAASLLHTAILTAAGHFAMGKDALPYLSGTGEYIATQGYGEYIATQGYGGFGAYQQYGGAPQQYNGPFQQAAAGYGAMMQAAAGPFQQAAAGYGLSQAAAGTGEYIASGAQGYGEYIATQGFGDSAYTYDGIPGGDLSAAEHALNVAEAAAGLGFGDDTMSGTTDVGVSSMVNPLYPGNAGSVGPGLQQLPIQSLDQGVPGLPGPKATIAATPAGQAMDDATMTGRRGVLAGGDGIFGGCSPIHGNSDWQ